jgi:hypothetical protein
MKREVYERRLARIVDAAVRLKKAENQLRRKTCRQLARAAKSFDIVTVVVGSLLLT